MAKACKWLTRLFLICHELTVIAACVEAKLVFDIL